MSDAPILCIGACHWDLIGRTAAPVPPGADLPGRIARSPGGVALNIAVALARLGARPLLLSAIGTDPAGEELSAEAARLGLDTSFLTRPPGLRTDLYLAIEGEGGLIAAIADARTLEATGDTILAPLIDGRLGSAEAPFAGTLVLDGNLTPALLARIATDPCFAAADLRLAAASAGKADRLAPLTAHPRATLYLNLDEARVLGRAAYTDAREAAAALGARRVLVTDGPRPAALALDGTVTSATPPTVAVARVTGAGDALLAAHIMAERHGAPPEQALAAALDAAAAHVATDTDP